MLLDKKLKDKFKATFKSEANGVLLVRVGIPYTWKLTCADGGGKKCRAHIKVEVNLGVYIRDGKNGPEASHEVLEEVILTGYEKKRPGKGEPKREKTKPLLNYLRAEGKCGKSRTFDGTVTYLARIKRLKGKNQLPVQRKLRVTFTPIGCKKTTPWTTVVQIDSDSKKAPVGIDPSESDFDGDGLKKGEKAEGENGKKETADTEWDSALPEQKKENGKK